LAVDAAVDGAVLAAAAAAAGGINSPVESLNLISTKGRFQRQLKSAFSFLGTE
jgi:hypothetical protein